MKQFPTLKVDTLSGIARRCPFPINKQSTGDGQLWILTKMLSEMLEKSKASDVVICDRSVYDVIAYTVVGAKDYSIADWMLDFVKRKRLYDTIYFHRASENEFCFGDGLRDTDICFRAEIDRWLVKFYQKYDIPYILWRSDRLIQ
jgi:hypothetical protein